MNDLTFCEIASGLGKSLRGCADSGLRSGWDITIAAVRDVLKAAPPHSKRALCRIIRIQMWGANGRRRQEVVS